MNRTPLILAIVLLLLQVLYVGSYLALVEPKGRLVLKRTLIGNARFLNGRVEHYRAGGEWSPVVFWPLEQIDQKLRPRAWDGP